MLILGCDLHTRYQVIAMLDATTGEVVTRRLGHEKGEARAFYASRAEGARVGIEATGCTQWFERLLAELGHQLWGGTRRRSGRGRCGGRRPTRGTPSTCWICC